jgi:2-dehydro-3-deoxygluconokinase
MNNKFDVVTFGETMLRFTPPGLQRWEQTHSFEIHVGGSESNTAVGLARLGCRVSWISRLTDNALGRMIARTLIQHGVDTSSVIWTEEDRVGLYFLEEGRTPRGSQIIYDRRHSALTKIQRSDINESLFAPGNSRWFHCTGITPALSSAAADVTTYMLDRAKHAGWKLSFDINYRRKLWTPQQALAVCQPLIAQVDLLFSPLRDARELFSLGAHESVDQVLRALKDRFPNATVILTCGPDGALAFNGQRIYEQPAFVTEPIGRLGGGDAFTAGYLASYIRNDDIALALRYGAATAAMKYSIPGDLPLVDRYAVEALIALGETQQINR